MTKPGQAAVHLTPRDLQLIHSTWSLGYAATDVLRALHAPDTAVRTVGQRLALLTRDGYFVRTDLHPGSSGNRAVMSLGPAAGRLGSAYQKPWRPSRWQMAHTLAVGDVLVGLLRMARGDDPTHGPDWKGEAEIRSWAVHGDALPDLLVGGPPHDPRVWLSVEVDRGTEGPSYWRRKLQYYLHRTDACPVLAATTDDSRARRLAELARAAGVPFVATTMASLTDATDDARERSAWDSLAGRVPLRLEALFRP